MMQTRLFLCEQTKYKSLKQLFVMTLLMAMASICRAEIPAPTSPDGLRGVYLGKIDTTSESTTIGRLALELFEKNQYREVRLDHRFRSGDRFRFKVSSNLTGWLYILHRSPSGEPQILWPPEKSEDRQHNINYLEERMTYAMPPAPDILVFDEEVGSESFYIAIRSKPTPPALMTLRKTRQEPETPKKTLIASKQGQQRIVQFSVRAPNLPDDRIDQGLIFTPGTQDADPYVYFSSTSTDKNTSAMIEFQLHHIGR